MSNVVGEAKVNGNRESLSMTIEMGFTQLIIEFDSARLLSLIQTNKEYCFLN